MTAKQLQTVAFVWIVLVAVDTHSALSEDARPTLAEQLFAVLEKTPVGVTPADEDETSDERSARLRSIASDAASVAGEKNPKTALLLLGVAEHESAFARNVDRGPCWRGKDGKGPQCDSGQAACMMQVHGGSPERNAVLFADRKECFRTALKALVGSRAACAGQPAEWMFSAYASGSCISDAGHRGSSELYAAWAKMQHRYDVELAREAAESKKRD